MKHFLIKIGKAICMAIAIMTVTLSVSLLVTFIISLFLGVVTKWTLESLLLIPMSVYIIISFIHAAYSEKGDVFEWFDLNQNITLNWECQECHMQLSMVVSENDMYYLRKGDRANFIRKYGEMGLSYLEGECPRCLNEKLPEINLEETVRHNHLEPIHFL